MCIRMGETPFICDVCDAKFNEFSKLTIHMRIHTGEETDHLYARVDTSNQLDTDEDCKPSYSACETAMHDKSEDLQHSLSDNSRRLVQTSDNRTQSVYLSDHVRVDTSNQLDTDEDCKPSYSACDTDVHVESGEDCVKCTVCSKTFISHNELSTHMRVHTMETTFCLRRL